MIEKYSPSTRNIHIVRITFNKDGYTGHVSYMIGGNSKGAAILETASDFFTNCDIDDVNRLNENDCQLKLDFDDEGKPIFSLILKNQTGETLVIDDFSDDDLNDIMSATEIADCFEEKN